MTTTEAVFDAEAALDACRRLTQAAAKNRAKADAALTERAELVDALLAEGVPLARIAERAGVTHGALQAAAKKRAKKSAHGDPS